MDASIYNAYHEVKITCESPEYKPICKSDNLAYVCVVIISTGVVASLISLVAPISTWILFRKTRNIHNYISLNQCITATLFTAVICAIYYSFYTFSHSFRVEIDSGYMREWTESQVHIVTSRVLNIVQAYMLVSMYCWNIAAAVLCYSRVVKVFSRQIPRKYLTVNLLCYVAPIPLVGIHGCLVTSLCRNVQTELTDNVTIISVTTILTVVLVSLYVCVAVAICKGRRPGHGETIRSVTTAMVIATMFGLWFCITFAVSYFLQISGHTLVRDNFAISTQITHCILISAHPVAISLLHVVGRVENRKKWVKLFSKNTKNIPGI